jgi:ATP-dependent Lon protease
LRRIVQEYTREPGVRQLERVIASVARKAARRLAGAKTVIRPFAIGAQDLPDLLGPPQFPTETAETIREYGVAIGLAWNPVGGDILFIEAARMPGTGKLLLTGSLGDVMKESAQTALTYLRGQSKLTDLDLRDFDKQDIHIHVPAGATPKDGPSAGVTITVALASLLSRRKVRSDVAMTGEISLRGRVLPVGGVKEKILAANRSGIRQVILPEENRKDWIDVPEDVRERINFHFVRRIDDVFPLTLRPR